MRTYLFLFFTVFYSLSCSGQEFKSHILKGEGTPLERHENALAIAGNKLILIGGRGEKPIDIYDLTEEKWSKGVRPPMEIHHMQAVSLNGLIYILGGFTGSWPFETPVSHVLIYDVTLDEWSIGSEIPADRRRGAAGVVVYNGKIYLINGIINGHTSGWVNWLDEFDPYNNSWKKLPNSPVARDHFQAGVIGDQLYVGGGRRSGSADTGFAGTVKQTDVYNFKTQKWEILADIPTPRAGTSAVTFNNKYMVIGGESDSQEIAHNEIEVYDPRSNTWTSLNPLQTGRHGTQAVSFGNHIITGAGSGNRGGGPELSSFEVLSIDDFNKINIPEELEKGNLMSSAKEIAFKGNEHGEIIITNASVNKAAIISYIQVDNTEDFKLKPPLDFPIIVAPGKKMTIGVTALGTGNSSATLFIKSLGNAEPLKISLSH